MKYPCEYYHIHLLMCQKREANNFQIFKDILFLLKIQIFIGKVMYE